MTYEHESMELITIEQLPVVAERFSQMVEPVRQRVSEILAMDCTEETKKAVKAERASLNRFREEMKKAVKAKKDELFAPWSAVESEVKRIEQICKDTDAKLSAKIADVENEEKHQKEAELRYYFREICSALGVEWLKFEDAGITIRLSDSMISLYRKADEFTERVAVDVTVISGMDNAGEILAEYKKHFVLSKAVKEIAERRRAAAQEAETIKAFADKSEKEKAHCDEVCAAVSEEEKLSAPVCLGEEEKPVVQADTCSDKCFTMGFKVYGTLEQLRGLKRYITENGIQIID